MDFSTLLERRERKVEKSPDCRGILVEKVVRVAPGHNKFRISVSFNVVHLRFFFKGLMSN